MSSEAFAPINPGPILHCEHCLNQDLKKKDLKRCGGCSVVMYCSKECQKAAWPKHKEVCRWRPQSITEYGYSTPLALLNTVREWTQAHYWTLTTITNAIVHLGGGWQAVLDSPNALYLELQALPRTSDDANPSEAFHIMRVAVVHKDKLPGMRTDWADVRAECDKIHRGIVHDNGAGPAFAGVLPARIVIKGTDVALHSRFLLYRLSVRHVPDSPDDPRTRAAFTDLVMMCTGLVGRGVVLRASEDPTKADPDLGFMERAKKSWKWRKAPQSDWEFVCSYGKQFFTSDLSPTQLFTLFKTA